MRLIGLRRENSDEDDDRKMTGTRAKDLLGLLINAGVKKKTSEKMESCSGCLDCSSSVNNGQGRSATSPLAARTKKTFSVEEMVEECKTFFFAGKQSTSNLLTWTTVLLAMNPEWQKLAREEVLEVCGSRDIPTKDDIAKLKTVRSSSPPPPFFLLLFGVSFSSFLLSYFYFDTRCTKILSLLVFKEKRMTR